MINMITLCQKQSYLNIIELLQFLIYKCFLNFTHTFPPQQCVTLVLFLDGIMSIVILVCRYLVKYYLLFASNISCPFLQKVRNKIVRAQLIILSELERKKHLLEMINNQTILAVYKPYDRFNQASKQAISAVQPHHGVKLNDICLSQISPHIILNIVLGFTIIFLYKNYMAEHKEIVVSLNRLTFTNETLYYKIALSVSNADCEIFSRIQKNVKSSKINFYRQNLFIMVGSEGFQFNIYEISHSGTKQKICSLQVGSQQLLKVNIRATSFEAKKQNISLSWDSWTFSQNSEDLNILSQRDYSEFQIIQNGVQEDQLKASSSHLNILRLSNRDSKLNKRSVSTEEKSSSGKDVSKLPEISKLKNQEEEGKKNEIEIDGKKQKKMISSPSIEKKAKKCMRSQMYSNFVAGFSSLISSK